MIQHIVFGNRALDGRDLIPVALVAATSPPPALPAAWNSGLAEAPVQRAPLTTSTRRSR